MLCNWKPLTLFLLAIANQPASSASAPPSQSCYCFPGDSCWPTAKTWDSFNKTIGGRLIETVPIASVCHGTSYNAAQCSILRDNWNFPQTHLPSSSSVMAPLFSNDSCNPFTTPESPCTLGNYVRYAVRAKEASDVRKALQFAKKNNIRFVIRNTGHDYNGKSTGAGALSVWTRDLNTIELVKSYRSLGYNGRALKLGAGVEVQAAYAFAAEQNGIVVGGNCPTVGIAGGLSQGGGHGPLATKFGLAADQVLEWDVLTASGETITASPKKNSDLYWALCGGGPGTYGVVLSMTVKLHASTSVSAAKLSFASPADQAGSDNFWGAIKTFAQSLPAMVDAGLQVTFTLVPGAFIVSPATGVGVSRDTTDKLFNATLSKLDAAAIPYQYSSQEYASFLDSYKANNLPGANVSDSILGGRMLPRSSVGADIDTFIASLKAISASNYLFAGIGLDVSQTPASKVAANPYWRKTLIVGVLGTFFNYADYNANLEAQKFMTTTLMPQLDKLTKGEPAAYVNEANFLEPNWQQVFYGTHYRQLDQIKRKYDPQDTFYALGAVGSDRWVQQAGGKLCRV